MPVKSPLRDTFTSWLVIGLIAWCLLAGFYTEKTPPSVRTYDFAGHLDYSTFIFDHSSLPKFYDLFEAYHPPLYYLMASLLNPHRAGHVRMMRYISILLGAMFLWMLADTLVRRGVAWKPSLLAVFFIGSTPSFVFVFTSYNNDALSMVLALTFCLLTLDYFEKEDARGPAAMLLFCGVMGVYTKSTMLLVLMVCFCLVAWLAFRGRIPLNKAINYGAILAVIGIALLPWCIFHNYRTMGEFFPVNCNMMPDDMLILRPPLREFFSFPLFQAGEWTTPFIKVDGIFTKGGYWIFRFVSSVFCEFSFLKFSGLCWIILVGHFLISVGGLAASFRSPAGRLVVSAMVISSLLSLPYFLRCPYWPTMDFRYLMWTQIGWVFFYTESMRLAASRRLRFIYGGALTLMISLHIFLLVGLCLVPKP